MSRSERRASPSAETVDPFKTGQTAPGIFGGMKTPMTLVRGLIRYTFAPLFFLTFIAAAVWTVQSSAPLLVLPGLLAAAIAGAFLAEGVAPYEPAWNRPRGDARRDALHALVNEAAVALSVTAVPLLSAVIPGLGLWPAGLPLWLQLALAVLVADAGITLAHFASHRYAPLWRLHAVHHSVTRMYGFNGLMKHPLHQAIETLAGTAPLLVLGLPHEVAILLGFAVAIQVMLQHANVDMRIGPLAYVWAVAPAHRHHHVASKTDGDVNFGLFTSLWDHLLGTFVIDRPGPRDGELGVAGEPDYPVPYLKQLAAPFRRE